MEEQTRVSEARHSIDFPLFYGRRFGLCEIAQGCALVYVYGGAEGATDKDQCFQRALVSLLLPLLSPLQRSAKSPSSSLIKIYNSSLSWSVLSGREGSSL